MEDSFDRIVTEYQDRVYRLAVAMLGDRGLAEEAAQEAFVRIWKGLKGFRGDAALGTWIYSITRNTCRNLISAARSRPAVVPEQEPAYSTAPPARARIDVEGLLAQLPERYRQVVRLYYLEEKSYEEVSRMLDLPMGTVKTFLHRARKELVALTVGSPVEGR